MIDFKALKSASKKTNKEGICGLVLGPSAAGKSTLLGSFKVPTLVLHTSDESHTKDSVTVHKGDVLCVAIDRDDDNQPLSPDDTLKKLIGFLISPEVPKNFGAVGLDSVTSIDLIIKRSQWFEEFCRDGKGKRNDFKATEAVITKLQEIFAATEHFREKGVHFLATAGAQVKAVDGDGMAEIVSPVLSSFGCAEAVPRMAGVVLYVGRAVVDGESKRALLFNTKISKESKDLKGHVTKMLSFSPRFAGVLDSDLPEVFPADMSKLLAFVESLKKGE